MSNTAIQDDYQSVLYQAPKQAVPKINCSLPLWARGWFGLVRSLRTLSLCAVIFGVTVALYFGITRNLIQRVEIVGQSMAPTLPEKATYFLNRRGIHTRGLQRSDIVVIKDPADHGLSVKRIIGLPGEAVHIKDGQVLVNCQPLAETYLPHHTYTFTYAQAKEQLIVCGTGRYFVMGDNRAVSIDSRSYGPVPRQNILGLLMLD